MGDPSIRYYDGLNNTPALPLAFDGHAELRRDGLVTNTVILQWDQEAVVAFDGDEPVGVIVFQNAKWLKTCLIILSYVRPEARRRGFYRRLLEEVRHRARLAGMVMLESNTHVRNGNLLAAAEALDRKRSAYVFIETL